MKLEMNKSLKNYTSDDEMHENEYSNEIEWRHHNEYRNETECSLDGNEGTNQCIIECIKQNS